MGTDIHAFVEVDWGKGAVAFEDAETIRAVNGGEWWVWRDYELFDALGDGRSGVEGGEGTRRGDGKRALYPARGLPRVVSGWVYDRYHLRVMEWGDDPAAFAGGLEGPVVGLVSSGRAEE